MLQARVLMTCPLLTLLSAHTLCQLVLSNAHQSFHNIFPLQVNVLDFGCPESCCCGMLALLYGFQLVIAQSQANTKLKPLVTFQLTQLFQCWVRGQRIYIIVRQVVQKPNLVSAQSVGIVIVPEALILYSHTKSHLIALVFHCVYGRITKYLWRLGSGGSRGRSKGAKEPPGLLLELQSTVIYSHVSPVLLMQ